MVPDTFARYLGEVPDTFARYLGEVPDTFADTFAAPRPPCARNSERIVYDTTTPGTPIR